MTDPVNIAVGVTTFDRQRFVGTCLPDLYRIFREHRILIYDDASTEFDREFLLELVPTADIHVADHNSGGADLGIIRLLHIFLETEIEYFILLDSDLIIDPEIVDFVRNRSEQTDGLFSIFNTPSHPSIGVHDGWLIKPHIGSAGTVWRKDVVEEILREVPPSEDFDWDWSRYFTQTERKLLVSQRSYVQHLGFAVGQNSSFLTGDLAIGFQGYTPRTLGLMFDEFVSCQRGYLRELAANQKSNESKK